MAPLIAWPIKINESSELLKNEKFGVEPNWITPKNSLLSGFVESKPHTYTPTFTYINKEIGKQIW